MITRVYGHLVTGITVAYNDSSLALSCAEAMLEAGIESVIVWDNSTDAIESAMLRKISNHHIKVLSEGTNCGFGSGNNRAVRYVETPYVLLVNPDCNLTSDAIELMFETLRSDPAIGIVAPRMVHPTGTPGYAGGGRTSLTKELAAATRIDDILPPLVRRRAVSLAERLIRSKGMTASTASGPPIDLSWVSGFCVLLPTAVYRKLNGFDERYFLYFEDVDLCERLRAEGYRVVLDRRASVTHQESTSMGRRKNGHYWRGLSTYYELRGARVRASVARTVQRVVDR